MLKQKFRIQMFNVLRIKAIEYDFHMEILLRHLRYPQLCIGQFFHSFDICKWWLELVHWQRYPHLLVDWIRTAFSPRILERRCPGCLSAPTANEHSCLSPYSNSPLCFSYTTRSTLSLYPMLLG